MWLGLAALISPLGFNCHSRTDLIPAGLNTEYQPDSDDQIVRTMPIVEADGAPIGDQKVRLSSQVTVSASQAVQMGLASKLSSQNDAIVTKGTTLVALYDNDCRGKNDSKLRFEAEEVRTQHDQSLAVLSAEAASDPCLVRVDESLEMQLIVPMPDYITADFRTQAAGDVSALATVNDPRANEARHIAYSKALQAWDWFYSGSGVKDDVIVAVIDTGILHTHPDLVDNRYLDSSGNNGFDFVNNDNNPTDDQGHGTHVAGIVGARANNGIGVTGVMGTQVKLMGVKVLNAQGSGTNTAIVNGIRYAADQGAHVINMSLGGRGQSTAIRDAMVYAANKGVVIVVAAGNDNTLLNAAGNFYSPAGYSRDIPGAIAVGSVDAVTGARSNFSNFSTDYVWIGAPGSNGILSTITGNGYSALQGTSMASPVVAGAAALLVGAFRAHGIQYTPQDVISILTESSRIMPVLNTSFRNGSTLDIERSAQLFYSRYVMAGNSGTEILQ
jgi:subtilisin family serine protease